MLRSIQFEVTDVIALCNFENATLVDLCTCVSDCFAFSAAFFFRLNFVDMTAVFTHNTTFYMILILLKDGFKLFYHSTPYIFHQNHKISLYSLAYTLCKFNVYKITNTFILSYVDIN